MSLPSYSKAIEHWSLDRDMVFLNHGSFGATPTKILAKQQAIIQQMEREPVRFMVRELEPMWWEAKAKVAAFVGAESSNLVFVKNATMGVNTIIHSLSFDEGDEILTSNHIYGACYNTLNQYAIQKKFSIKMATIPFPFQNDEEVLEALIQGITPRTKLLLIDHITSATGSIFPIENIVSAFESRGIEVLVDGAHAPGMMELELEKLGASYFVGNCHKWICSPKGSAILYVRKDKQPKINPLQFSHVHDKKRGTADDWSAQFFWPGTDDISAYLCVPDAIQQMQEIGGSWEDIRKHNKNLVVQARNLIAETLGTELPVPEKNIGFISNILIGPGQLPDKFFNSISTLQETLFQKYKIEVPIFVFDRQNPRLWVRVSAQLYNSFEQYEYLAAALKKELLHE